MVNAWSLLHSEMNGTMDEDYPIMSKEYVDGHGDVHSVNSVDMRITEAANQSEWNDFFSKDDSSTKNVTVLGGSDISSDTLNFGTPLPGGMGEDHISFTGPRIDASGIAGTQYDDPKYYYTGLEYPDGLYSYYNPDTKPKPNLNLASTQKYQEDKGIKDLKDYVASTYQGHYTNDNSDVQTLDLIHSVGDAESFCRSNAIKYLSRYDKKGQAKRDILKAMHYCLLLYYFSGNTNNETPTRGYETF